MKRFVLLSLVLACGVSLSAQGGVQLTPLGTWVGKVQEYANPFDANLDRNVTAAEARITVAPGWTEDPSYRLSYIVNRRDGVSVSVGGGRISGVAGQTGWVTFQAMENDASKMFHVGTIITYQRNNNSTTMPWTLKLGTGGSTANWASSPVVQSGGGAQAASFQIVEVGKIAGIGEIKKYDSFRLDITAVSNGTADFNEVLLLPDRLERIPVFKATNRVTPTSSATATDLLNSNGNQAWRVVDSPTGDTITFEFSGMKQVDAIVFWGNNDITLGAEFTLRYVDSTTGGLVDVASINMKPESNSGVTAGMVLPLQLLEPIMTNKIILEFPAGTHSLREVMLFTALEKAPIPEPATMTLLALGGLALLRRRRA